MHAPTVIIGGGPVGLVASIALSDVGVENVVVERESDVYGMPRAIVMDAEVRCALERLGLADQLARILSPMVAADFVKADGETVSGIDLRNVELFGCPAVSKHFQPMLDAMLRDEAARRGAQMMIGRNVISHETASESVTVVLDDDSRISGEYLIGCDGASSRTRKSQGIVLEDLGFDQDWLVVDLRLHNRSSTGLPDVTRQVCDPRRPTTLVSGFADYYRFEFQLQPGEDRQTMTSDKEVWRLLAPWLDHTTAEIVRRASYRFHAVVAERMHDGRVLLAGDSAHQMPPFMGQGLNSGMRDAINLAWKLAYVQRGWCDENLLATYSSERIPHARATVQASVDTGRLIDQIAGRQSHGVSEAAAYGGDRRVTAYRDGVVVGDHRHTGLPYPFIHRHADVPRDSFILMEDEACVRSDKLDPASAGRDSLGKLPLVVRPVDRISTLGHDAVVVRPDGYVAACCERADLQSVMTTLRQRLCVRDGVSEATAPRR
jgi:3-(3-hydroxy-phenyl)propionate hydroxylase